MDLQARPGDLLGRVLPVGFDADGPPRQGRVRLVDEPGRQLLAGQERVGLVTVLVLAVQRRQHRQGHHPPLPAGRADPHHADDPVVGPVHDLGPAVADRRVFEVPGQGHVLAAAAGGRVVDQQVDGPVILLATFPQQRLDHTL